MPLGTEVGLSPGDVVLDGTELSPRKRAQQLPHFSAHFAMARSPISAAAEHLFVFITARRSYASAVLGVVILSVCPSVRLSHACFVTNSKNRPAIFLHHTIGQSFYSSDAKDLSEIPTVAPQRGRQREVG